MPSIQLPSEIIQPIMEQPKKASLLGLPGEPRNKIYEYVLCDLYPPLSLAGISTTPPLRRANRQIHRETLKARIDTKIVQLLTKDYDEGATVNRLRKCIERTPALKHLKSFRWSNTVFLPELGQKFWIDLTLRGDNCTMMADKFTCRYFSPALEAPESLPLRLAIIKQADELLEGIKTALGRSFLARDELTGP